MTLSSILAVVLVTIVIAEVSLQILARLVPTFERVLYPEAPPAIPDDRLGAKGNPNFFEHDAYGFRNPLGTDRSQIVAIGDSQTYGTHVRPSEAWPKALERLTGCTVYSSALGGYGPLHYAELARDAAKYKPKQMIVAIYFGNDFYDNWKMYRTNPTKYPVPDELLRPAMELESVSPFTEKLFDFFGAGKPRKVRPKRAFIGDFIVKNSALWGYVRAIKHQLPRGLMDMFKRPFDRAVASLTAKQLEYASVFDANGWRTILTSRYRQSVEDVSDPRVLVGRWLTEWAIEDIERTAHSIGASVLFVLLPTKESVFVAKVDDRDAHKYLEQLVRDETLHRKHLADFFAARNLPYVDATEGLRRIREQPYFENSDGHPNPRGHEAIARMIKGSVRSCRDARSRRPHWPAPAAPERR